MTSKQPKIIHISCHGALDEKTKEFYLEFEKHGAGEDGINDKFSQSRLQELLGDSIDHRIKLAFVSACYSEEMGNVLLNCGIPFVVSVNSETPIADEICLIFSRHLYMQLLQGTNI